MDTQLPGSAPPFAASPSARPSNGLGVAALVLGVASLVAAVFDNCVAKAGDRSALSNCIARFANDVRP